METTRCRVLLAVEPRLAVDHQALIVGLSLAADIQLVGTARGPWDLLYAAYVLQPDVLIQSWPDRVMPGISTHLLMELPDLLIIGVASDGLVICERAIRTERVPGKSLTDLLAAIRRERPGAAWAQSNETESVSPKGTQG